MTVYSDTFLPVGEKVLGAPMPVDSLDRATIHPPNDRVPFRERRK